MNAADHDNRPAVRRTKAHGAAMWAQGTIAGYAFEALVYPEHAADPAFELGQSRITKLYMRIPGDAVPLAEFDRGWMMHPDGDAAQAAARAIGDNLARQLFGD